MAAEGDDPTTGLSKLAASRADRNYCSLPITQAAKPPPTCLERAPSQSRLSCPGRRGGKAAISSRQSCIRRAGSPDARSGTAHSYRILSSFLHTAWSPAGGSITMYSMVKRIAGLSTRGTCPFGPVNTRTSATSEASQRGQMR